MNKLAENIINRFKFPYFQDASENLQADVISFLILNLDKYDQQKGAAFSYFSILAKNYLILGNQEEYKFRKSQQIIDPGNPEYGFDLVDEDQDRKFNDDMPEFVDLMLEYWDNNIQKIFTKRQEIQIADAILNLFRRAHNVENFNKKALYLMIREMTGLRTQYITTVVNKMRQHNDELKRQFLENGSFNVIESLDDEFL